MIIDWLIGEKEDWTSAVPILAGGQMMNASNAAAISFHYSFSFGVNLFNFQSVIQG